MKKLISMLVVLILSVGPASAASKDVLLGAGDNLKVSVFGNPDLSLETKVSEEGSITFPLIGAVTVAGMTTSNAEKRIAGKLESGGFIRNPQVSIYTTLLQSQQVSVLGYINHPGRYPLDGKRSLTDMVALAGGTSAEGGDTVTLIRHRNGEAKKSEINITEMVRSGNMKQNLLLENNDVLFVERAPHFYIFGEVQRPGSYRLEPNMNVLQVMAAGGGLSPRGTTRGVKIKRTDENGKFQMLDANLDDVVQVNDVVYVKESLF